MRHNHLVYFCRVWNNTVLLPVFTYAFFYLLRNLPVNVGIVDIVVRHLMRHREPWQVGINVQLEHILPSHFVEFLSVFLRGIKTRAPHPDLPVPDPGVLQLIVYDKFRDGGKHKDSRQIYSLIPVKVYVLINDQFIRYIPVTEITRKLQQYKIRMPGSFAEQICINQSYRMFYIQLFICHQIEITIDATFLKRQ